LNDWEHIANMLRAYSEQQRSTWGNTDDVVVAKYLSGDRSPEVKTVVERAITEYPALGELLEVLGEIAAAPLPMPSPVVSPAALVWRELAGSAVQLAERLVAWLDEAGRVAAAGLQSMLATPQMAAAGVMRLTDSEPETGKAVWSIPLPGDSGRLTLFVGPAESLGLWSLLVKLDLPADTRLPDDARLEIRAPDGRQSVAGPLASYLKQPIKLKAGTWRMTLEIGPRVLLIPVDLGSPATADSGN
jgi:hypothetical protein